MLLPLLSFLLIQSFTFTITHPLPSSPSQSFNQECNPTYFQYQNVNKLLINEFMQLTFNPVSETLQGNQVITANHTTYKILPQKSNFSTSFYFNNTNQTLSFIQNDQILFQGGKVHFQILFQWSKNDSLSYFSGEGKALGVTREIPYLIRDSQNASRFVLSQVFDFTVAELNIHSLTCSFPENCSVSDDVKDAIEYLLIEDDSNSISKSLESRINEWMEKRLEFVVCCNNSEQFSQKFNYSWKSPYGSKTFQIERKYRNSHIEESGKMQGYYQSGDLVISNSSSPFCNRWPADSPFNGYSSQEFISVVFMQEMLQNAIKNGALNSIVNRATFSNDYFNFTSKELSDYLSNIRETFGDEATVEGNCTPGEFTDMQSDYNSQSIRVQTSHSCQFFIDQTKILTFYLTYAVFLKVSVGIQSNLMDLKVGSIYINYMQPSLNDSFGFKVRDESNLKQMIQNVVKSTMVNHKVVGSGWPMFLQRSQPQTMVLSFSVMIYDKGVPADR